MNPLGRVGLHPPHLVQRLPIKCRWLAYGLFQLTHMSRDDHAVEVEQAMASQGGSGIQTIQNKDNYCSTHNFATRMSLAHTVIWENFVVKIFS